MINTDLTYGVHTDKAAFDNRLTIGRHAWKTTTNVIKDETTVIDANTFAPSPGTEAALFGMIIAELAGRGLRTLNNTMGRVSAQMASDAPELGLNLWYHVTDQTGSVSLATYQAPWDDVSDRIDLAVGVLMAIDPAEAMLKIELADAALVPLVRHLVSVKELGIVQRTLIQ